MGRENQVGLFGDGQLAREVMAAPGERFGFVAEEHGIDHDAPADDIGFATLENSGGDGAQDVFLTVEFERMPGVGAALEACHDIVPRREHIDHLSFALVTPL